MKKIVICLLGFAFFATGCGNNNWFKFAHKPGSSSDVESLSADADVALINKDFGAALNYYEQILSKDPTNSEALYGASAAWLGAAGFDVSQIITNVMTNKDKLSSPVLPVLIKQAGGISKHSTADFLPKNFDWLALRNATAKAIIYLRRITAGGTDNVISPNNTNVRVNLIICLVLNYAIQLVDLDADGDINNDPDDPVTILNDYSISYPTTLAGFDADAAEADRKRDLVVSILTEFRDTVLNELVTHFNALIAAYKVDTGDTIGELKEDILTTFSAEVTSAINTIAAL